jgi:hypothetical protein
MGAHRGERPDARDGGRRVPARLDAAAAERLLAGEDVGFDRLTELLAAASAPARPRELAGEEAAMASFRYREFGPVEGPRRSSARTPWARLVSVKVAVVAVALTTAGVALAASTGVLPAPWEVEPSTAAPSLVSSHTDRPGGGRTTTRSTPPPSPAPSLVGLCRAYRAGVASNPGKALDNPAFGALIAAAGGRDRVERYCDDLLDEAPGPPTDKPDKNDHQTGPPSRHPDQVPGKATRRPTG